jgi:ribosomal subunit interface protein
MIEPNIKTTNFNMTDEVQNYIEEKVAAIERLITYENEDEVTCDVELEQVRDQHGVAWRAEMNLLVHGEMYRAEASGENVNAALDEVKDEIMKRVRRSKRKRFDMLKRGGARLKEWMRFGRE